MDLPRAGREYAKWPVSGLPADASPLEMQIDGTWYPVVTSDDQSTLTALLAGPDFDLVSFPQAGTIVIPRDQINIPFRLIDDPEHILTTGGNVRLITP